jgi:hypothetical protein
MGVPPKPPGLNNEQRQVLALLASFPRGITEDTLVLAHGFDRGMIEGLVDGGLATADREAGTGRTTTDVVRIRITDAGRMALEG